jgi:cytochrome c-type biogenesis protein CcmH
MKNRVCILSFLFLMVLIVGIQPVYAQQPTPSDDRVNKLAREIYCPVCENTPLDVCPTKACAQWRDLIREKMAAGWTDRQIKDFFAAQYGDRVLAEPPMTGTNWLIYILPPVGLLLGLWLVFRVLFTGRKPPSESQVTDSPVAPPSLDTADITRVEEELVRYKKR